MLADIAGSTSRGGHKAIEVAVGCFAVLQLYVAEIFLSCYLAHQSIDLICPTIQSGIVPL